jgi:threonine dehydratase
MFSPSEVEDAQAVVYSALRPTPQYAWPLLTKEIGATVWVKHENHHPVGAFKVRGGLTYFDELTRRAPEIDGVISATRGNHGQSIAFAATRHGKSAVIVVPHGNSKEKNAAMKALGAELIEHGADYQASREHAAAIAEERRLHFVPPYHRDLVRGVMTCWIEFFEAARPDVTFIPIGMGSGFCAAAAARAHLGAKTRLIGIVSAHATACRDSVLAGKVVEAPVATVLADGMACRIPDAEALEIIRREADDIVTVSDDEVAEAMRLLFAATHNVAEGAGAASLAAAMNQKERWSGKVIGTTVSGGNVDSDVFASVLDRRNG